MLKSALPQTWVSSFQYIAYAIVVFAILVTVLLVVLKLRNKPSTNQSVDLQGKKNQSGLDTNYSCIDKELR